MNGQHIELEGSRVAVQTVDVERVTLRTDDILLDSDGRVLTGRDPRAFIVQGT